MPFSHEIDRSQRIVLSRLWGTLTTEQIDEHRRRIRADPDFDPELRYLVDMRGLTSLAYSSSKVRHAAATQIFRGSQRRAIVTATDEQYGVARMFATLAALEGEIVEPFRDWTSAAEWLGLDGALAMDPGPPVATS
jgi:hypothetical protein